MNTLASTKETPRDLSRRSAESEWLDGADASPKELALDGADSPQSLADLDLQRHPVPYYFIRLMGKLTRLHPMVIHDVRISVAHSLTRAEWFARTGEAGIARDAVRLRWFLFRFAIGRLR